MSVSTTQISKSVDGPQEKLAKLLELRGSNVSELQLANAYWEVNDLAKSSKVWTEIWAKNKRDWTPDNQGDFSKIARNYASVTMEAGSYDLALDSIKVALERDGKQYGLKSKEYARTLNNLAICEYFKGYSEDKPFERAVHFKLAQTHCRESSALWGEVGNAESNFNIENNNKLESIIARDLKEAELAGQLFDLSQPHSI